MNHPAGFAIGSYHDRRGSAPHATGVPTAPGARPEVPGGRREPRAGAAAGGTA